MNTELILQVIEDQQQQLENLRKTLEIHQQMIEQIIAALNGRNA